MTMRLLSIGIAVVLVDLRLNKFDLLPDVVGWLLVLVALWDLAPRAVALHRALVAGVVGAVAALVGFLLFFSEVSRDVLGVTAGIAHTLAWVAMHWFLLTGIAALAQPHHPAMAVQGRRLALLIAALNLPVVVVQAASLVAAAQRHSQTWTSNGLGGVLAVLWVLLMVVAHGAEVGYLLRAGRRGRLVGVED